MAGAADPMMNFPAGTFFRPYSVVRNISEQATSVKPTLWWMAGNEPHSASLPAFTVLPHTTHTIDMPSVLAGGGLKDYNGSLNVVLEVKGPAQGLAMSSGSIDEKNTYVFEVVPRAVLESVSKSLGHWSINNGDDTMITLWNPADEAQDFTFTLSFEGGHYKWPIHLGPRATEMFNISEIIHNQIPDLDGSTIPGNVHEGSAEISGSRGENEHILVVMDAGTYSIQKATCVCEWETCNGLTGVSLIANPWAVGTGKTNQLNFTETYNTGSKYNVNGQSTWTSSTTTVATVAVGLVRGVGAGSSTVTGKDQYLEPAYVPNLCAQPPLPSCPVTTYQPAPTAPGTVTKLTCTSPVTRGGSTTCTVTPSSGVTVSSWKFTDGSGNTVTSSSTSLTWSGTMVTSGTVTVNATASGTTTPLSASITVNTRNWRTSPASPVSDPNGTFYSLPVPPQSSGNDAGLGISKEVTSNGAGSSTFISDHGPNNGYGYYATQITITTSYQYEINPDLQNTSSTFYQSQCGNYNGQTNPSGYISGANLLTQTNRHEWNSANESHYAFYSTSISGNNNPGNYVEQRIAVPGTNQQTFDNGTASGFSGLFQNILNDFDVEPFPVNDDATGRFLGNINYAPYHSCS